MFFLNPTYLWALLGLVVPIAIHLWSKKEGKTIKIGSIRLLEESDSKQASSIRLNEWWLLFLRMLSIIVLVCILSGFQIRKKSITIPITYLIEPSLLGNEEVIKILDTLETGESLRLLQKGFPELDKDQLDEITIEIPKYWQLAREMKSLKTDSIVVFTNAYVLGIQGVRPEIQRKIEWIVLDSEEIQEGVLKATRKENDIQVLSVSGDQNRLCFSKELAAANENQFKLNKANDSITFLSKRASQKFPITSEKEIKVSIHYKDGLINEMRYLKAAFMAISKYFDREIEVSVTKDTIILDQNATDLVVWLQKGRIPKTIAKKIIYQPDGFAQHILEPGISLSTYYLTKSLDSENVIQEHLSEQLVKVLDFHKDIKDDIKQHDYRTMSKAEFLPLIANSMDKKANRVVMDISHWLWMLLVALFIVERIMSKVRKQ